ncbi:zinc finger protein 385B isoform X3 [Betta splendens]|uniref:Zinc finger protein 385B isoform X3 n=1 Tax=Betta splendens TaxID=158456 RepID=A0A9W2XHT8_BETSP|nr:zinc finger protein 385B isoform X3 [Betta splendens]
MKTPLSPSRLLESGQVLAFGGICPELVKTHAPAPPSSGQGGAYSLCEVCNLQLTSAAQAQLHYNGRSHLRRVRQLQSGEGGPQRAAGFQTTSLPPATGLNSQPAGITPALGLSPGLSAPSSSPAGSGCGAALPGLIGASGPSLMMKPFLPFPVETPSPVGFFPNFNTMDPVQKAVINHTFGVTMVPKKKQVISCTVCQLRFNSDSQAEAHYRGSRHAKKLKSQENKAKAKLSVNEETNGSPPCPAPDVTANSSTRHTELLSSITDPSSPLKPFLLPSSLPFSSSSPSSSRAGSEPPPSSPPLALPAPGLSSSSSSSSSASSKASPPPPPRPSPVASSPSPAPPTPPTSSSQDAPLSLESEEEKAKKLLYCSLCKVAVNSLSQLEAHNAGSKHKTMLEARSGAGPIKAYPRPGAKLKNGAGAGSSVKGSGLQNKTFHCQICDVHVNSEIQLKQHISSRRHKDRVAGKPTKPKYSPYNKQQRGSLTELVKPSLSPSFLSTPFAAPPSSLTSSISLSPSPLSTSPLLTPTSSPLTPTISLHPRPPSSSLFAASFLRPAPGPIRASQGSILFTPY